MDREPRPAYDHAEMLAYHWGSALELGRAAGADVADIEERTRLVLRDAGDRAFALNAFAPAEAYSPRLSQSGLVRTWIVAG